MTSANVKAMVAKMVTVGFLAVAAVVVAPTKAQAQWSVGVGVGAAPYYGQGYQYPVAPAPVYGYDAQAGYYGQGNYYGQAVYARGYGRDDDDRRAMYFRRDRDDHFDRDHFDRDRFYGDDRRDFRRGERH